MSYKKFFSAIFVVFALILIPAQVRGQELRVQPETFDQLEYRHIGPKGNRTTAVVGVEGDPLVAYAGAASGGIWKTTDGGSHWKPIFDNQQVQSIGALDIAQSDPNIVWAGTGEAWIRSNISIGNGVYKSMDAGETWKHMGLDESGRIPRVIVHPRDPNIVYVAVLGHSYGPQKERGIYRTTDGGEAWEQVLFVDENTGCSDLAMDPSNPNILIAGMWQLEIKTWARWSGGPGSGLYMSRDGGTSWKRLEGHGLPTTEVGKIAVAIARSNSKRIYALIETGDGVPWNGKKTTPGVLWRSDDGGENWKLINYDHNLTSRPHYYSRLAVLPDDEDEVYFVASRLSRSLDGGHTQVNVPQEGGGDRHDMWIDPTDPNRMLVANDHDVNISLDRGKTWRGVRLPIAQMYHVEVDNQIPYNVYGNRQDGPSFMGPSRTFMAMEDRMIPTWTWQTVGGCECGFTVPDPEDNNLIWSGCFEADLTMFDLRTGHVRQVRVWPETYVGWPAADVKYRIQWTFPITISPHDHNKVYTGSQYVHQTTDQGHSWTVISPDLSTNDKSKQQDSGGLTFDNLGVEYACLVFAIAESPLEEGVIWAGTNDGLVQLTQDGGGSWTNVTPNIPDLPPWGTVSNIEPSRYDAGSCYITVNFHQVNNRDPYVYKTTDYGKSWKFISSDIPKSVWSYAHCVREDPAREGMLYLGTENAVYVSFNDGGNWQPLQSNLPHAPVHWLVVQEHFNDLVIGTYGRGFWIMDDITPLQQLTPEVLDSDVHLFAQRPVYRFLKTVTRRSHTGDTTAGENPPDGASINYFLKDAPEHDVKIAFLDGRGQTIQTLEGTKNVGINRVWWDLRHRPEKEGKLRTSPIHAPYVKVGPEGWRPLGRGEIRPLVVPGTYTVKLTVGEKELTEELIVKKDPNSSGTEADIRAQVDLVLKVRDDVSQVVDMINTIESIRRQINDLSERLEANTSAEPILTAGKILDEKLIEVEENLFQMRRTGPGQDGFRWPTKLHGRLLKLADTLQGARGAGSDFAPTTQQIEVYEVLKDRLVTNQRRLDELLRTDFAAFNDLLGEKEVPHIIIAGES